MTNPEPHLPAPLNGAGRTISQRLTDLEAAVNALGAVLQQRPTQGDVQALRDIQDSDRRAVATQHAELQHSLRTDVQALRDTQDSDRQAAVAQHTELLQAVAASVPPPVIFPDLAGLQRSVASAQDRLGVLEQAPGALPSPTPTDDPDLLARLAALESALGLAPDKEVNRG